MKNAVKFLGIIALAAIIGFSMTSCGDAKEDFPSGLVAQWYLFDDLTVPAFELQSNGTMILNLLLVDGATFKMEVNGNTMTLTTTIGEGSSTGTAKYTLSGNTLTIAEGTPQFIIPDGEYYK